jgi:hypothetical protein
MPGIRPLRVVLPLMLSASVQPGRFPVFRCLHGESGTGQRGERPSYVSFKLARSAAFLCCAVMCCVAVLLGLASRIAPSEAWLQWLSPHWDHGMD